MNALPWIIIAILIASFIARECIWQRRVNEWRAVSHEATELANDYAKYIQKKGWGQLR